MQVVVPEKYRSLLLKISHDEVAGHLGVKKTYDRILCYFFRPKLKKDLSKYIIFFIEKRAVCHCSHPSLTKAAIISILNTFKGEGIHAVEVETISLFPAFPLP